MVGRSCQGAAATQAAALLTARRRPATSTSASCTFCWRSAFTTERKFGDQLLPLKRHFRFGSFPDVGPQDQEIRFTLYSVAKLFLGDDERNFLGPLMRFLRRDVRDHIACQKTATEFRIAIPSEADIVRWNAHV